MFSRKSKYLRAVCTGQTMDIRDMPDEAFASGMLGRGYAIEPTDTSARICSPVDGVVAGVTDTAHAYTIQTDDGLDVLVHIGVDTVQMKGEGFRAKVTEGQRVKTGDLLGEADMRLIRQRGFPTMTAVLITNPDGLRDVEYEFGAAEGGRDAVMRYRLP